MSVSIAYLGPPGTYTEAATLICARWLQQETGQSAVLCPYPSNAQVLKAVDGGQVDWAVVPVENSIEGGVTMTLDTLWQLDTLHIQRALVMPIVHALISCAPEIAAIKTVYSHPQGLGQCQTWLEKWLPNVKVIPGSSTTEGLQYLESDPTIGVISSQRAAELYNLPILACPINDHPDNCTRFLCMSRDPSPGGSHTSLAFSVKANQPGVLLKPLQVFAERHINLTRIESRPTKRSLGDYVFFLDLAADQRDSITQTALAELVPYTETLKIFGSYDILSAPPQDS
jgi:prephenate dehydratase